MDLIISIGPAATHLGGSLGLGRRHEVPLLLPRRSEPEYEYLRCDDEYAGNLAVVPEAV